MEKLAARQDLRKRPWYSWLPLTALGVVGLVMFYNELVRTPHAKMVEQQLEVEFNKIVPHPQAATPHFRKSYKDTQALVETNYTTAASFEDLRNSMIGSLRGMAGHLRVNVRS